MKLLGTKVYLAVKTGDYTIRKLSFEDKQEWQEIFPEGTIKDYAVYSGLFQEGMFETIAEANAYIESASCSDKIHEANEQFVYNLSEQMGIPVSTIKRELGTK